MKGSTYHIEHDRSGRAKCRECKETIAKGELRIATKYVNEYKGEDVNWFTHRRHLKCFQIPSLAMKGISHTDFVNDHLEDDTDGSILDDETQRAEIVAAIAYKPPRARYGGNKDDKGGKKNVLGKRLAEIKEVMENLPDDDDYDEGGERPAKKAKKSSGDDRETFARAMKKYNKMKNVDLKSVIRWNLGCGTTGAKDLLLLRCIDGHVNGRLGRCPTCFRGKLNLKEEDAGATIICKGYYDEDIAQRIPCGYATAVASAPRLQPWYSDEPTEEEIEAMKSITKKHEAVAGRKGGDGNIPPAMATAAKKLEENWESLCRKEKAQSIVNICTMTCKTRVDLPQDEKKASIAVGKFLMSNMDATALEMLGLVIKEFGLSSAKEKAWAKQKSAMAGSCEVSANAGIVQAFHELSKYYFKDGNSGAGFAYTKAISPITRLDYEITEDNAKCLAKGKTKVFGIRKRMADKIYEFYSTGTIQQLEEKRALHS
eukprot:CAMPEP_0181116970 /NCGR_PEP_ID=MMETSP1071-20121207/22240_1 /TAXON_ID=35127 /ORGANISM="Thalassiosira sp., Strain NH16" /LENGTH=484 /DNA_ID=CAMNT_0023201261 /DNA_START=132 /DNA_END=1586 /DNA_ORIENTATION=-